MLRSLRFYLVWATPGALVIALFLRDIAVHPWIRQTSISLQPGGEPLPARYALSALFWHYPPLGVAAAVIAGFSLACVLAPLLLVAQQLTCRRAGATGATESSDGATDCPPVAKSVPPGQTRR